MKEKIYPRDLGFLVALCGWIDQYGRSPTIRELTDFLGLSGPNAIREKIIRLRLRGLVAFEPSKIRTLRPLVRIEVWR